jgi:hypothetical protein
MNSDFAGTMEHQGPRKRGPFPFQDLDGQLRNFRYRRIDFLCRDLGCGFLRRRTRALQAQG